MGMAVPKGKLFPIGLRHGNRHLPAGDDPIAILNAIYDVVMFVDRANGNDSNDGLTWATANQTINGAMADILAAVGGITNPGRHFAVIYRGRLTGGNTFTQQQQITIPGVHLLGAGLLYGMGGGWDACFVGDGSGFAADAQLTGIPKTRVGLEIRTDDVVVAGLKFYANSVATPYTHLAINDSAGGSSGGGRNCAFLDNVFQGDVNGVGTIDGIGLNGSETSLVAGNMLYYLDNAIVLGAGLMRNNSKNIVEENRIFCPAKGILLNTLSTLENSIRKNTIIPKQSMGMAFVNGIYVNDAAQGNAFEDNRVHHTDKATSYHKGAGTNTWILNYYTPNVLYDGT
jgi:hypothetical protein